MSIRYFRSVIRRLFSLSKNRLFLDPDSWRIIRCTFDGVDYIHRWSDGVLVWFEPTPHAVNITVEDLPLFLNQTLILEGDQVLIAGAGMGSELLYFSKAVGSTGKILAIEPDANAFRRLRKLVSFLPNKNVQLFNLAVGSVPGTATLYSPDSHTISNSVIASSANINDFATVEVETIDNICHSVGITHLDYLKMNIEGAEFDALLGVEEVEVSHYCISCHDFLGDDFATSEKVIGWLLSRGFKVWENEIDLDRPWVGSYVYGNKPSRKQKG